MEEDELDYEYEEYSDSESCSPLPFLDLDAALTLGLQDNIVRQ